MKTLTSSCSLVGSGDRSGTGRPAGSSNGSSRITVWLILKPQCRQKLSRHKHWCDLWIWTTQTSKLWDNLKRGNSVLTETCETNFYNSYNTGSLQQSVFVHSRLSVKGFELMAANRLWIVFILVFMWYSPTYILLYEKHHTDSSILCEDANKSWIYHWKRNKLNLPTQTSFHQLKFKSDLNSLILEKL